MEMHLNKRLLDAARPYPAGSRLMTKADESAQANDLAGKRANVDADLTRRQLQVLALLVKGEPNKAIANALGIAEGTVKIHLTAIFKALRVQNRSQAAVAAVTAALRPDIASGPIARYSVQGWPGRHPLDGHPLDSTERGHIASLRLFGPVLKNGAGC